MQTNLIQSYTLQNLTKSFHMPEPTHSGVSRLVRTGNVLLLRVDRSMVHEQLHIFSKTVLLKSCALEASGLKVRAAYEHIRIHTYVLCSATRQAQPKLRMHSKI